VTLRAKGARSETRRAGSDGEVDDVPADLVADERLDFVDWMVIAPGFLAFDLGFSWCELKSMLRA
jgi:hypothetical protein